jgi:hypothetical protein
MEWMLSLSIIFHHCFVKYLGLFRVCYCGGPWVFSLGFGFVLFLAVFFKPAICSPATLLYGYTWCAFYFCKNTNLLNIQTVHSIKPVLLKLIMPLF